MKRESYYIMNFELSGIVEIFQFQRFESTVLVEKYIVSDRVNSRDK